MTLRQKRISLSIALMAASTGAFATTPKPTEIWCHNCTPSQVSAAVLASPTPIGTPIYVGDVVTGATGAYMVFADVDDSHSPPIHSRQVENTTVDAHVMGYVTTGIQFYQYSPIGWHKVLSDIYGGTDTTASGYTVSDFGQGQNNFNTWRNSTSGGIKGLANLFSILLQSGTIINGGDPAANPTTIVTTTFNDGTVVTSQWDNATSSFKLNPDLSVDSENNPIPYTDSNGTKRHLIANRHFDDNFDGSRDQALLAHKLTGMQIPMQFQPYGEGPDPSPGGPHPVICVTTPGDDGNTPQITCYSG
jgi:hypothetical protein